MLREAMRERLLPDLKRRGFDVFSGKRAVFPSRYMRVLPDRIDTVEFQWDKYGKPRFIINFRSIESQADLERARQDADIAWRWNGYFRAHPSTWGPMWFGPRGFWRLAPHRVDTVALVEAVLPRVADIDAFMRGGPPTRYLRDCGTPRPADGKDDLLDAPSRAIGR